MRFDLFQKAFSNFDLGDDQAKINNPEELFQAFDVDGDGEIGIEEFVNALQESETLKGVTESLKGKQVEALQENHEMLLVAFKYLDADHSGAIDRDEFKRGIDVLNKRLPERNQLGDPQELFDLIDADGNGEIGKVTRMLISYLSTGRHFVSVYTNAFIVSHRLLRRYNGIQ